LQGQRNLKDNQKAITGEGEFGLRLAEIGCGFELVLVL